ncbi:hypothetical protein [Streptomyces griseus]|uniref:hypothetical protein n=1 Tax=Streptomyces griseus TaxID=1911 RepID=UPI00055C3F1A|nr:hypothetical protein [Streptomyces griseus]
MYRKNATRRAALAAGLALALGIGVSAQASAGAPRSVTGKPSDSVTRTADFYGAYIDAKSDPDRGGRLAEELRKYYIHPTTLKELAAWEAKNGADGVLRAQNVPVQWKVTDNGTADYTEVGITLTWGDGSTTKLVVDMSRSHRIIHIGTKGLESS